MSHKTVNGNPLIVITTLVMETARQPVTARSPSMLGTGSVQGVYPGWCSTGVPWPGVHGPGPRIRLSRSQYPSVRVRLAESHGPCGRVSWSVRLDLTVREARSDRSDVIIDSFIDTFDALLTHLTINSYFILNIA